MNIFRKDNRNLLALLLAPIFLCALLVSNSFVNKFMAPKEYFLYFYSFTFFVIFTSLTFKQKTANRNINLVDFSAVGYFIYTLLCILLEESTKIHSHAFLTFFGLMLIYGVFRYILTGSESASQAKILLGAITIVTLITTAWGYLQLFDVLPPALDNFKIGGSYGNPGPFSNFLSLAVPLLASILVFYPKADLKKSPMHFISIGTIILAIALLPFTQARTAWIATFSSLFFLALSKELVRAKLQKLFNTKTRKVLAVLILAASLGTITFVLYNYKKDSANGRIFIWERTTDIIKEHPFLGSGFNSFVLELNKSKIKFFSEHGTENKEAYLADNTIHAFNEYLHVASELGILGISLFLLMLFFLFAAKKPAEPYKKALFLGSKASLISFCIASFFSYPLREIPTLLLFYFNIATVASIGIFQKKYEIPNTWNRSLKLLLSAVCLFILPFIHTQYKSEKQWKTTLNNLRKGKPNQLQKFEKLYPKLKYNGYFLYNYGSELSNHGKYQLSIKILSEALTYVNDADTYLYLGNSQEKSGNLLEARKCYETSRLLIPHKLYPQYRLVYVLAKMGELQEAQELAKRVLASEEKVKSSTVDAIKEDLKKFTINSRN